MTHGPLCQKRHCGRVPVLREGEYAGLCLVHLESALALLPSRDLADVPCTVLAIFGLKKEYFRE